MTNMLDVKDINVYYGAIHALKGLSFYVNEGEIVSLIGANGAGKTTAMHTISGLLRSKTGDILFMGDSIAAAEPHKIVRLGLAQVPEGRRVFSGMTVQENLEMGAFVRNDGRKVEKDLEMVFTRFPRLKERRRQRAGTLSGGEQQMLAIGRALMSRPKMLLLDEPSMGLSPILVNEIFDCIQEVNKSGTTILLVEQNAKMALSISHRAYVLETGKIIIEGKSSELLDNEKVKRAYLGG
ncbi:MAG: ABC transporter ATP-binding protein [Oscillospiraceae bacterium]|nr:ABC transporter ATP-binding protein [Oscillospiraceae bacterium]